MLSGPPRTGAVSHIKRNFFYRNSTVLALCRTDKNHHPFFSILSNPRSSVCFVVHRMKLRNNSALCFFFQLSNEIVLRRQRKIVLVPPRLL
jgi:hypothetical protein